MLQVKEITWDMIHYDVQLIGGIAEEEKCEIQT
jgi:preprotein translocase subunit SecA